jgi:hypothetical protein
MAKIKTGLLLQVHHNFLKHYNHRTDEEEAKVGTYKVMACHTLLNDTYVYPLKHSGNCMYRLV